MFGWSEKLDRVENKLDRLENHVANIDKHLAIYNEQLTVHIEGVVEAKKQNNLLKEYIDLEVEKIRNDIAPIKNHVVTFNKIFWFLGKSFAVIMGAGGLVLLTLNIVGKL